MTLLIRGHRDIRMATEAVEVVWTYLQECPDASLTRLGAFESLIYQRYPDTNLIDGLLHQLATDALHPKALYEWWGNRPSVSDYSALLARLAASLKSAMKAYELAEKRFSRSDTDRIDALRDAQLAQGPDVAERLDQARVAVERAAGVAGRATLLEAVLAATGTALVPEAVVDAARAALVADLKGQHNLRVYHLKALSGTWNLYEFQPAIR